jgi:hypothetical protein
MSQTEDTNEFTRDRYDLDRNRIERLLFAAMEVSQAAGGIKTSTRNIRATQLYTRLTVGSYTFVRLLPANQLTRDLSEFWDWPSVACIARNIMETYHAFHYLSSADLSDEEVDMRISLMHLHLNSEKYKLYKEWKPGHPILEEFERGLPKDRERLQKAPAFSRLTKGRQADLLRGRAAMHLSQAEVGEALPFMGRRFCALYRLLSTHVHSVPFSFVSQSNERGRGDENSAERFYMSLAIAIVVKYLSSAVLEMARMFPDKVGNGCANAVGFARESFDHPSPID